jgi:hypothetical protein
MESLEEQLELKRNAQKRGSELLQKKADALLQYTMEPNLFKKALHYHEALAAAKNYSFMAHYHNVPKNVDTVILQDNILLSTKGTVWTKKDGGMFATHRQVLLGSATILPLCQITLRECAMNRSFMYQEENIIVVIEKEMRINV